jgi:uncharacterized membrane protein YraQ (UPF0718 family)
VIPVDMGSNSKSGMQVPTRKKYIRRLLLFPALIAAVYGAVFIFAPDKATEALGRSGKIFLNIAVPIALVFCLMVVINLYLKPAHIAKFLGKGAGVKGIFLSTAAGIISMGPIYAWYPLLKEMRKKGTTNSLIAVFLGNRAVKPFLLPVMISYFGWVYVLLLTFFTITGSVATGFFVSILLKE